MKRILIFLLIALLLAGCTPSNVNAPSTATATDPSTPSGTASALVLDSDLVSMLEMTRADVSALAGTGEAVPFSDISDYNETTSEISGFPCSYAQLNGVQVFYDATPMAEDATPYYCVEDPADRVTGLMLPAESAPYNIDGVSAALSQDSLNTLLTKYDTQIEHVDGMFEYYRLAVSYQGVEYVWQSDSADMTDPTLYVFLTETGDSAANEPDASALVWYVTALTDNFETISADYNNDGAYYEELLYDGMVRILLERIPGTDADALSIARNINALNGVDAEDISVEQNPVISAQLGYPAWWVTYTTGSNEDTLANVDIYVQTDGMDYRFHTSTPVDALETYSDIIEAWIDSLSLAK